MRVEYMREFVALGTTLSFSRAAEELYISQPTLSRHMASLEEELGCRLLLRTTHSVELTSSGKLAFDDFSEMVRRYDSFMGRLDSVKQGHHGDLRVTSAYYAVDRYLNPQIAALMAAYPDVSLTLRPCQPYEAVRAVLDEEADIALSTHYEGDPDDPVLKRFIVNREPLFVTMPSAHPLANRASLLFKDLSGYPMVLSKPDDLFTGYVERQFASHGCEIKDRFYAEQVESVNAMILMHGALALQFEHLREQPNRGIAYVPLAEKDVCGYMVYVYRDDNANPTARLFLEVALDLRRDRTTDEVL